ncbi:MAG: 2-oxoacid ferredoxin oxidoreductase [Proteobacteria bacterium]|nr:2-oxoacid ferredoxin oxidoreductase [Pseudomonadota bacterium]
MSPSIESYHRQADIGWCPGCGNFGILDALKKALVDVGLEPHQVMILSGIGQGPKLPHYLNCNALEGLHGREVAMVEAAKIAADDLVVIVHAGDGGAYGEGGNHLLHAIRRDVDLTLVVHDNKTYGLTKGQASPTTDYGLHTALQPRGLYARPLNPLSLAVSQGCTFVAQGLSARQEHLAGLIAAGIKHPGLALINALQPCVTWDKVHTYQFYEQHCYELDDAYDPEDQMAALELTMTTGDRIPLGVIHRAPGRPYDQAVLEGVDRPLRDRGVDPRAAIRLQDRFK